MPFMPKLYTYCIPVDDGAAPNPYWGVCTLAICKPAIRRTAQCGDWVVGTGSKRSPIGDISNRVVYAMRISKVLTFQQYDRWTKKFNPNKIPKFSHSDVRRRLGDSIYDYSTGRARQRRGVHNSKNKPTDLRGKNVLISDHFFYFGNRPRILPPRLRAIVKQTQGHRVRRNRPFITPFLRWLKSLNLQPNKLYGLPATKLMSNNGDRRCDDAKRDLKTCSVC